MTLVVKGGNAWSWMLKVVTRYDCRRWLSPKVVVRVWLRHMVVEACYQGGLFLELELENVGDNDCH